MTTPAVLVRTMLEQEAWALLTRLEGLRPFALQETMVQSAALSPAARIGIDRHLLLGRRELAGQVRRFIRWLRTAGTRSAPAEQQRRFTLLRLRFNAVLSELDLFSDAITQRSEHGTGVWLSGLDVLAADALELPAYYQAPPVVCYLDRGPGAAIRRARTRLPAGGDNPVAVIRVPRERMVGYGIASSLVHEVGHQVAALLDLVPSLRRELQARRRRSGPGQQLAWMSWERWISEIVADFWSVGKVGISSTLGLIGVVSLPPWFVFRMTLDDPHPFPWIRVQLSCAIGDLLYPHPQWRELAKVWSELYPLAAIRPARRQAIEMLLRHVPALVELLADHRPASLRGASLPEVLPLTERRPEALAAAWESWRRDRPAMASAAPSLVFAVIGQARANGRVAARQESRLLGDLLTYWAVRGSFETAAPAPPAVLSRATRSADPVAV